jgi:hypothetical protein
MDDYRRLYTFINIKCQAGVYKGKVVRVLPGMQGLTDIVIVIEWQDYEYQLHIP